MKFNVIRALILPWFLFFVFVIAAMVLAGIEFHIDAEVHPMYFTILGAGTLICFISNLRTLSKAGIWIAHSLPSSLRYSSWPWIFRAVNFAVIAVVFYYFGQLSWIPLVWQGFVIPFIFSVSLFIGIWSLMGPLLVWSSRMVFGRTVAFLFSLPIFALVPLTAMFLGKTIVTSYVASRPELVLMASAQNTSAESLESSPTEEKKPNDEALEERALEFKAIAEAGKYCGEHTKEITQALDPKISANVVYWAVKSIKCSDMKSVVGLPRLADLMLKHQSPKVRAAAILAMPRFGQENVSRISYLLVKRVSEKESPEVIEAAASVLVRLGEDERKWATGRLKGLLDNPEKGPLAAEILVEDMKRDDLVGEFVLENLTAAGEARSRAVGLICQLPKTQRTLTEPHIPEIVAAIKSGDENDPAIKALSCLGASGFQAIRHEVTQPQVLDRPVAARAFAEMDVKSATPEALKTAEDCVRDKNDEVRKWCSQSLGKIGAPALPKILDLLESKDSALKDAGRNALSHLDDPAAKDELEKIRAENSGWMANRKKLQIAEAVSTALIRMENETTQSNQ